MKRLSALFTVLILLLSVLAGAASAESKSFYASFLNTGAPTTGSFTATMDDEWFTRPSDSYQHMLCRLSMAMTMAAFRDTKVSVSHSNHNIVAFLREAGFTDAVSYGYEQKPTEDSISNMIASRRISDEKGEFVLLAVPVCGAGYGDEWLSNLSINNDSIHAGFKSAATQVYQRVKEYMTEHCAGERVKVWVTGFSRAAATSNLLGSMLLTDSDFDQNDIFVYTFGTPNTTKEPVAYPQIFNICGSFDPVPKIPFREWGFSKHGVILYLPSLETDPDYAGKTENAGKFFSSIGQKAANFGSLPARNFLICKVLSILNSYIPESMTYSSTFQRGVLAAWRAKGGFGEKINALLSMINPDEMDPQAYERIRGELTELVSMGITDTLENAISGGDSSWFNIASSGVMMAYEHYPEVYASWLYTNDDPDALFSQGNRYSRIICTGNPELLITVQDPADGMEKTILDSANGIQDIAVTVLRGENFINLPAGYEYHITATATAECRIQFGFSNACTDQTSMTLYTTNPVTVYPGEVINAVVKGEKNGDQNCEFELNGDEHMTLFSGETGGNYNELLLEGRSDNVHDLVEFLKSALVMLPFQLTSLVLLFYCAGILIKRLIRHRIDDTAEVRPAGKYVLYIAAVIGIVTTAVYGISLIQNLSHFSSSLINNKTLRRVSEIMGYGIGVYLGCGIIIYLMMTVLSLRSIHHQLSRIRLSRLSMLLVLFNVITVFVARDFNTLDPLEFPEVFLPLISMIGLLLVRVPNDESAEIGRRWLPVTRCAIITMLLFFIRQVIIWGGNTNDPIAVILKAPAGIPVIILAAHLWRRKPTPVQKMTFFAMLLYFLANTVINISLTGGMLLFIAGHITLAAGYINKHRPSVIQLIVWAVISVLCCIEVYLSRSILQGINLAAGFLYAAAICAVIVTGFPISGRMRVGTVIFLLSNQLLVITLLYPGSFALESVELLLYYIAILILTSMPEAALHGLKHPDLKANGKMTAGKG